MYELLKYETPGDIESLKSESTGINILTKGGLEHFCDVYIRGYSYYSIFRPTNVIEIFNADDVEIYQLRGEGECLL